MGTTTIEVREDQADRLHDLKDRGDSYKDVIDRLLRRYEEGVAAGGRQSQDSDEGIPLTCEKCGHSWTYGGSSKNWATCPDCKTSVKVEAEGG